MDTLTSNMLKDPVSKHFNHPIFCVFRDMTIGELIAKDDHDLLAVRNFGKKSLEKVYEFRKLQIQLWNK